MYVIIVGMFLLEMLSINFGSIGLSQWIQKRADSWGPKGAGILGIVFALSFCPVSAALFFGSLIPLAIKYQSGVLLPMIYGIGTVLPVGVFAILIALGAHSISKAFNRLTNADLWTRRITGIIFIIIGLLIEIPME